MGNTLDGQTVLLFGLRRAINRYPVVILGQDPDGKAKPIQVTADGKLVIVTTP